MPSGHNPDIHRNPGETRDRSYDRLRKEGVERGAARKIADEAARQTHDIANRRK